MFVRLEEHCARFCGSTCISTTDCSLHPKLITPPPRNNNLAAWSVFDFLAGGQGSSCCVSCCCRAFFAQERQIRPIHAYVPMLIPRRSYKYVRPLLSRAVRARRPLIAYEHVFRVQAVARHAVHFCTLLDNRCLFQLHVE